MSQSHPINSRWNAIVRDFRRSGLTQADFCRQRSISLASFRYHFHKPQPSKDSSIRRVSSCTHAEAPGTRRSTPPTRPVPSLAGNR